jgi:Concanavalin A-like lectin/glucanases superfamily
MQGINRAILRDYANTGTGIIPVSDPYADYVTLLLHGDGVSGTQTYIDSSWHRRTAQASSAGTYTPTISSTQYKFGTASYDFHTNNAYPGTVYAAVEYAVATGTNAVVVDCSKPFTMEGWIYFVSFPSQDAYFISSDAPDGFTYSSSANGCRVGIRGSDQTLIFYMDNGTDVGGPTSGSGAVKFPSTGAWHHWAITSDGSKVTTYINGTASTTTTNIGTRDTTGNYFAWARIGGDVQKQGCAVYMDEIRCTAGIARYSGNFTIDSSSQFPLPRDPYWTYVVSQLKFQNNLTDKSQKQVTWSAQGALPYNSSIHKFGSYSLQPSLISSASTFAYTNNTTFFQPGTGDFTIEGWIYRTTTNNGGGVLFESRPFSSSGASPSGGTYAGLCILWDGSTLAHYAQGGSVAYGTLMGSCSYGISSSTWFHVAISRKNGTTYMFVNGALKTSYADSNNYGYNTATGAYYLNNYCRIGEVNNGTNNNWGALLSEVRITSGFGRYSTAFLPPIAPNPIE